MLAVALWTGAHCDWVHQADLHLLCLYDDVGRAALAAPAHNTTVTSHIVYLRYNYNRQTPTQPTDETILRYKYLLPTCSY